MPDRQQPRGAHLGHQSLLRGQDSDISPCSFTGTCHLVPVCQFFRVTGRCISFLFPSEIRSLLQASFCLPFDSPLLQPPFLVPHRKTRLRPARICDSPCTKPASQHSTTFNIPSFFASLAAPCASRGRGACLLADAPSPALCGYPSTAPSGLGLSSHLPCGCLLDRIVPLLCWRTKGYMTLPNRTLLLPKTHLLLL